MAHCRSHRRGIKLLASSFFVIIAAFMTYPAFFGRRTRGDEANLAIDIYRLIQEGSVLNFSYGHGQAYLTFVPTILRIFGNSYSTTNVLSPFIAALCLSSIVAFIYVIYQRESGDWVGVVSLTASFFLFTSFIGTFSETSHKAFIHVLVYMSFYMIWRMYRDEYDRRQLCILIGVLCVLSFFNILWAIIYSGIFTIPIVTHYVIQGKFSTIKIYIILPMVTILTTIAFLPTVTSTPIILYTRINALIGNSATTSTSTVSAAGFISEWPTITILGSDFSVWFVYTLGIFFLGMLSATALVIAFIHLLKQNTRPMDRLLLVTLPPFGFIMIGILASGSLSVFRRLMVFPGIIGLLYILTHISIIRNKSRSFTKYDALVIGITVLICTSSFLAIPRLSPDGHNNPYNHFSKKSDISRSLFAVQNQQSECLLTSNDNDINTAKVIFGRNLPFSRPLPSPNISTENKVYASDQKDSLYCRPKF